MIPAAPPRPFDVMSQSSLERIVAPPTVPPITAVAVTIGASAPALQLGDAAKGPLTLSVQVPAAPVQMRGAKFTQAEALKAFEST